MTRNFRSLIIAGLGTIGGSMIILGKNELSCFEQVVLVDCNPDCLPPFAGLGYTCKLGNIEDPVFLAKLLRNIPTPALFVNLCADVNNIRIREQVAEFDIAYIDSCASMTDDPSEYRFSKMMPYTLTPIASRFPHWLCWGINPGVVEIITRRLIRDFGKADNRYDVTIYEYDQLDDGRSNSSVAVGWCPSALVEEVMLSPTLQILDGKPVEEQANGAEKAVAYWQGQPINSRIVAHEDVWNIGTLEAVQNARFIYALQPKVMDILDGEPQHARETLQVPGIATPIFGKERVAVAVKSLTTEAEQSLVWEVDHSKVWQQYGVNAVQYQTSKSLLLALMLLQKTHYGAMAGCFSAADLPIAEKDWPVIDHFINMLGMQWHNGDYLDLRAEPTTVGNPVAIGSAS